MTMLIRCFQMMCDPGYVRHSLPLPFHPASDGSGFNPLLDARVPSRDPIFLDTHRSITINTYTFPEKAALANPLTSAANPKGRTGCVPSETSSGVFLR
jgi:hypothetical protein